MGILTLHFGQCGNQIASALFDYILNDTNDIKRTTSKSSINLNNKKNDYQTLSRNLWFSNINNSYYIPRSVLVDTENKVVSSVVTCNELLKFQNIVAKNEGGSANNWAYGYSVKGNALVNEVIDSVRKEMERSNEITHILSFLSSGGGTGSGTGSRVLESLRSEFPKCTIINAVVLPYNNGEIVIQNYNTLLTLAKLYDITDGIILLPNDSLHKICNTLLSMKNVDLKHINNIIAQKISAVFQPAQNYNTYDFVKQLTSHPNYKLIQIKTVPHITQEYKKYEPLPTWPTLISQVRKVICASNQLHWEFKQPVSSQRPQPIIHSCKSVASLLISRGGASPDKKSVDLLRDKELYPVWTSEADRFKHFHQSQNLYETDKFLALATNNNTIVNNLDNMIEQAWTLFKHKAYLHQYLKYDLSEMDFEVAFEKIECILYNYREI